MLVNASEIQSCPKCGHDIDPKASFFAVLDCPGDCGLRFISIPQVPFPGDEHLPDPELLSAVIDIVLEVTDAMSITDMPPAVLALMVIALYKKIEEAIKEGEMESLIGELARVR